VSVRARLLLVGVGGQGVLTAAAFLGEAALLAGLNVNVGQIHGMSQRGGSVEATVVIGPGATAHIAQADVVLGLEPLELLRALPRIDGRTLVIAARDGLSPFSLTMQGEAYPPVETILSRVREIARKLVVIDCAPVLREVGEPRALNTVMLGALAVLGATPFDDDVMWRAVERSTPPRLLETSRRAFALGGEAARRAG
jgi:indolepyruvate ferredoxin oxidoreductase beta subunit